jgi:hypothetical protein
MKNGYLLFLFAALALFPLQEKEGSHFSYHAWGSVVDSDGQTMRDINVCILPAQRPINGRIPCVKTTADGSFAITVKDVPDEYKVCASTRESPFILSPNPDPSHRVVCSDKIVFPAHDDCRKIDLKFEPKGR